MKKSQAVKHFGSQSEIARRCGLTRQAVQKWPAVVPFYWQHYLAAISDGKLKARAKP
jgi:transcriptional regulator with XRE-family HTH domain